MRFIFIYYIYLIIMLLDLSIKLKRSIINVLLQIVYFQEVLNGIFKELGRMYLPGTLELSRFISKLLVFMGHTLANKKFS